METDLMSDNIHNAIDMVCNLLDTLLETNDQFHVPPAHLTRFHAKSVPNISVKKYLVRIAKYAPFPSVCLYTVLAYIDRLATNHPHFIINSFNVHRVLITTLTLAVKFHCDHLYTNKHYAKVGGVSAKELMRLEFDMLTLLEFRVTINLEEIDLYTRRLYSIRMAPISISMKSSTNNSKISLFSTPTPSRVPTPQITGVVSNPPFIHNVSSSSTNSLNKHFQHVSLQNPGAIRGYEILNDRNNVSNSNGNVIVYNGPGRNDNDLLINRVPSPANVEVTQQRHNSLSGVLQTAPQNQNENGSGESSTSIGGNWGKRRKSHGGFFNGFKF